MLSCKLNFVELSHTVGKQLAMIEIRIRVINLLSIITAGNDNIQRHCLGVYSPWLCVCADLLPCTYVHMYVTEYSTIVWKNFGVKKFLSKARHDKNKNMKFSYHK